MKKLLFITLLVLILVGCGTKRIEVYYIERFPIQWTDTLIQQPDHWHYNSKDGWFCLEIPADTFCLDIKDTISVPIYMGTYKKKEYEIKWNLNTLNNYERKKCH